MSGARRSRILALLTDGVGGPTAEKLCQGCRQVTGLTGAGIMLMADGLAVGSVCAATGASALIEDLQYSLGEGPCVDAFRYEHPVLEPDLDRPQTLRWPAFSGPVVEAGVRAIFAFPVGVGAAHLGALHVYADRPGSLSDDQHADALIMAEVVAEVVLNMRAAESTGALAAELEVGSNFQYRVHQAAGMVSVQLDVSVAEALVRLRGYAFGHGQPLAGVAADVVARRLRFPPGST